MIRLYDNAICLWTTTGQTVLRRIQRRLLPISKIATPSSIVNNSIASYKFTSGIEIMECLGFYGDVMRWLYRPETKALSSGMPPFTFRSQLVILLRHPQTSNLGAFNCTSNTTSYAATCAPRPIQMKRMRGQCWRSGRAHGAFLKHGIFRQLHTVAVKRNEYK